ncbi:MAG TPA: hypothetical protein VMY98_08850 [Anaerolineae bacterium]|nr:hypothetical protein [Anaerolineae bacterium]
MGCCARGGFSAPLVDRAVPSELDALLGFVVARFFSEVAARLLVPLAAPLELDALLGFAVARLFSEVATRLLVPLAAPLGLDALLGFAVARFFSEVAARSLVPLAAPFELDALLGFAVARFFSEVAARLLVPLAAPFGSVLRVAFSSLTASPFPRSSMVNREVRSCRAQSSAAHADGLVSVVDKGCGSCRATTRDPAEESGDEEGELAGSPTYKT